MINKKSDMDPAEANNHLPQVTRLNAGSKTPTTDE